jgi:hypothetical protein
MGVDNQMTHLLRVAAFIALVVPFAPAALAQQTPCTDAHKGSTARYLWTGASGANNGTSWTDAWISQTTAVADARRGQTVCVADGSGSGSPFTYFTTAESGSVTITFVKATVADHGTSNGWTNAMGDGQYSWGSICIEDDYYVIDGNTRNENDWGDSSAYGFRFSGIGSNSTFCNSPAGNITLRRVDIGQRDGATYSGECCTAIDVIGGNGNWIVTRSKIHNASLGITTTTTANFTLEYSYGGPTWGKEFWRGFGGTTGAIVRFNILHDTCLKEPGAPAVGNAACTAPIAFFTTGDTNGNNYANAQIYGNVIGYSTSSDAANTANTNAVVYFIATNNSVVYNNTIVRFNGSAGVDFGSCSGCVARNNLWYALRGGSTTYISGGTASNNARQATDIFVDSSSSNAADRPNFRLTAATSPRWFSLSSPYDVDLDGETRAADGTGDIGAFEFDSNARPVPTKRLRIGKAGMRAPPPPPLRSAGGASGTLDARPRRRRSRSVVTGVGCLWSCNGRRAE